MEDGTRNNRLDHIRKYFKSLRSTSPLSSEGKLMIPGQTTSGSFVESKMKIFLGIGTAIVILIVISQSAVVVEAGHRGVVLYLGAVEENTPRGLLFHYSVRRTCGTDGSKDLKVSGTLDLIFTRFATSIYRSSPELSSRPNNS